uniref:Uncharacterized protein n=1 Tax=Chromera velia CCMP2878 TaxID=1169474 RepID=A0A0G4GRM1_9ALVE|eukprot:Cvel_23010.t1-p1 / transcript=Cvel_23010.t1 / gene=Cvel_23010 / organism=Chromera_velia_CCMP2878 / gene_product=hypothetical protein / transcript_product=hypothetical protein / location=Cvel_scaffold2323:6725-7315(+) / protein_length=170 / sequence_SO=supercontig / SO=protein_coding / is_pseudo=false
MSVNTLRSSLSLDMQAALEGPLREPAEEDEEIYNHAQGHRILLEKKGRGRKRSKGGTIAASQQRAPESPEKSKAVLFSTRFANFLQSWHMEYYVWGLTAFTITVIILNVWLTSRIWKYEKEDPWEQADVENRECRSAECHASLAFSYIERGQSKVQKIRRLDSGFRPFGH